nr:MAG TPA: hypothetical protein [Caudoviricetes sp.]
MSLQYRVRSKNCLGCSGLLHSSAHADHFVSW